MGRLVVAAGGSTQNSGVSRWAEGGTLSGGPMPEKVARRAFLRLLGVMGAGGMGLVAAAGCMTPPVTLEARPTSKPAASEAVVKFGYNPILAGAPIYFAQDRGYFASLGLQVEFTPFDSAALMTAPISTGQLDAIPAAPAPGLFNALARDVKLFGVAALSSTYATLLVRKDLVDGGQVREPHDLLGKRVSLNVEGSPVDYATRNILIRSGLTLQDIDVQRIVNTDLAVALTNRAVDAGVAAEPISTLIVQQGLAVPLVTSTQFIGNQTGSFLAYGPSFVTRTDDAPTRFMSGFLKGYRDYVGAVRGGNMTGPDDLSIVSKWTRIAPETIATVTISEPPADGRIDLDDLKRQQDFWMTQGLVTSPVDLSKIIDYRWLEAATRAG
jgi:NitT/TauT family transport system substrate-binding protein